MKHLFAPYELSVLAKEKGFDEPCLAYIYPDGEIAVGVPEFVEIMKKKDKEGIPAPLYQQLVDFLREKDIKVCETRLSKWDVFFLNEERTYRPQAQCSDINTALTEAFKLI